VIVESKVDQPVHDTPLNLADRLALSGHPMPKQVSPAERLPVPVELIERRIYLICGQKVMLDSDLAELY